MQLLLYVIPFQLHDQCSQDIHNSLLCNMRGNKKWQFLCNVMLICQTLLLCTSNSVKSSHVTG